MQRRRTQSGQTVPRRAPFGLRSKGTGVTPAEPQVSRLRPSTPKPVSATTAADVQQDDEQAQIAEWLRQRQGEQQARFASLPMYLKSDDQVLLVHQLRLVANQVAHDAAIDLLRRLSRTGS